MKVFKVCFIVLFLVTLFFATEIRKASLEPLPKLRGDEVIQSGPPIPYLGGRSPGDSIGITTYDYQANGSFGQRLVIDDNGNIHVDWMWCAGAYPGTPRYCAWNFRYPEGTWFLETQAAPSVSGYVQLDIVRDANPDNQVSAIAYHYDPGAGYFAWVDTDAGQGWGFWTNNPVTPAAAGHVWPYFCWTENGNIVMATGDQNVDMQHLYFSTDQGNTWTNPYNFDSCGTLSQFLRASRNSDKVVFVHTQWITVYPNVTLDNDVYYMLSADGGFTWGPHTNVTNYQPYPTDSVRGHCNVNAIFDRDDNLHIAWAGRRVTNEYWQASKIFHWDEVSDTITIVSSPSIYYSDPGGWWIATTTSDPGAWRMPADQPQLVVDLTNNDLYCLWHGNDDHNDTSYAGFFNGEFYGAKSTDGGVTWTDYTNLTNTRTPGAPSGACDDEDYMTANPFILNDSIYLTYVEDKDSGAMPQTEGVFTVNPIRVWVFHKDLIPGVKERSSFEAKHAAPMLDVYPNPFKEKTDIRCMIHDTGYTIQDFSLKIFDAAGQLIKDFSRSTIDAGRPTLITWQGDEPPGVYFVHLETENNRAVEKVVLLR